MNLYDSKILYGVFMLSLAVLAGGLKYVLAHAVIKRYKSYMVYSVDGTHRPPLVGAMVHCKRRSAANYIIE